GVRGVSSAGFGSGTWAGRRTTAGFTRSMTSAKPTGAGEPMASTSAACAGDALGIVRRTCVGDLDAEADDGVNCLSPFVSFQSAANWDPLLECAPRAGHLAGLELTAGCRTLRG